MSELDAAIAAAKAGGRVLLDHFRRPHQIDQKTSFRDIVTEADKAADAVIQDVLKQLTPDIPIQTEESGGEPAEKYWCVDPLDGTMHYAFGLDAFTVSVALIEQGTPVLGVVYGPVQDELFTGVRGKGAFLNGQPLKVSARKELEEAMAALRHRDVGAQEPSAKLVGLTRGLRVAGSTEQDLCYLAAGWIDIVVKSGQAAWDYAAGQVILEEAGGKLTNWKGGAPDLSMNADIAASNGALHAAVLPLLR